MDIWANPRKQDKKNMTCVTLMCSKSTLLWFPLVLMADRHLCEYKPGFSVHVCSSKISPHHLALQGHMPPPLRNHSKTHCGWIKLYIGRKVCETCFSFAMQISASSLMGPIIDSMHNQMNTKASASPFIFYAL